jgi:hypothetical protein
MRQPRRSLANCDSGSGPEACLPPRGRAARDASRCYYAARDDGDRHRNDESAATEDPHAAH